MKLNCLPRLARLLLGVLLSICGLGYCVVVVVAYLQMTSANSVLPELEKLDGAFFGRAEPVSLLERVLEATEGPMNRAGTMRPAFTDQSIDWDSLTQNMTAEEKASIAAEREGERLAVLEWVRGGLNREAYEADDFRLDGAVAAHPITAKYLMADQSPPVQEARRQVRIRSLVMDRCASCHSENGRSEHARWIPLDTFEDIERQCRPETVARPIWAIASLVALLPLVLVSGPIFYCTNTHPGARRILTVLPFAALAVAVGCWLLGQPGTHFVYLLLAAAVVAAIGVIIQITACLAELFAKKLQR